jgi:hypothetical protein
MDFWMLPSLRLMGMMAMVEWGLRKTECGICEGVLWGEGGKRWFVKIGQS